MLKFANSNFRYFRQKQLEPSISVVWLDKDFLISSGLNSNSDILLSSNRYRFGPAIGIANSESAYGNYDSDPRARHRLDIRA